MTFANYDHHGIVGVRPHPLPPSWLVVDSDAGPEAAWRGALEPGESRELLLTFRAGARAVGPYTSVLQVFEAATGEAQEVPLVLEVVEGTAAEEEAVPEPEAASLVVYPNPARGEATVEVVLERPGDVRVSVVDVLGRAVAVLHEGPLGAGLQQFRLPGRLGGGVYVVRVTGPGVDLARRVTLLW